VNYDLAKEQNTDFLLSELQLGSSVIQTASAHSTICQWQSLDTSIQN